MEEKKLTDEEVLTAIEKCLQFLWSVKMAVRIFNKNGRNFCIENKAFYKDLKRIATEHAEQKAEIERLTEELKNCGQELIDSHREQEELQDRNAELQKQVDEFNKRADDWAKHYQEMREGIYQQAVKDTAKEILQGFYEWLNQAISFSYDKSVKGSLYYGGENSAFHEVKKLVEKVAESKGVEVE